MKKMIEVGNFEQAYQYLCQNKNNMLPTILFEIAYDTENICSYAFIYYIILKQPTRDDYHTLAFSLLSHVFHFLWGYECSLHHIQKAIQINPNDTDLWTLLIFLNETPPKISNGGVQRVVTNQEAKEAAEYILTKLPTNDCALKKLERLKNTNEKDLPVVLSSDDQINIIRQIVSAGRFLDIRDKLHDIDSEELRSVLFDIVIDEENICAYALPWFLMLEEGESTQYHCLAADILTGPFKQLIGAYHAALYHVRRAIELSPDDLNLKEKLLLFNTIPEKLVSDEEVVEIKKKIENSK